MRTGAADDRRQAVYQLLAATARLERALKAVAQRQLGATQRRWRAGISRVLRVHLADIPCSNISRR